jgi:hypothetical protein
MPRIYQGISTLTRAIEGNTNQPSSQKSKEIIYVRVLDIILDNTHPKFSEYGEWNGIGTIFFDSVQFPFATETANVAIPLSSNYKIYPVINELVPIIFLASWDSQTNTSLTTAYYLPPINVWNSQHHNAIPDPTKQPKDNTSSDYEDAIDGSSRDIRRVNDESTDINLGPGFNEQINTRPLLFKSGDNLIEGRWGNSLRLGSYIKDNTNYPNLIIRNGQPLNLIGDSWVPIVEDINKDQSSIYLTSNQNVDIEVSSKNYNSYTEQPISPKEYDKNQIILNSGRLLFNTTDSDILLSSKKSINLNSVNFVNIDTNLMVIDSAGIFLGSKEATEPLLKGNITVDILLILVNQLANWFEIFSLTNQDKLAPQAATAKQLVDILKNQVAAPLKNNSRSKQNFTI